MEPRKMYFTISYVYPDVPVNIDISRLHEQTVLLRFQNTHAQDLKDISWLERGLYVFLIKASGDGSIHIQEIHLTLIADGPPKDMIFLSFLLGLAGILIFFLPDLITMLKKEKA